MKTFKEFICIAEERTEDYLRKQGWDEKRIADFMKRQSSRTSTQGTHFHQTQGTYSSSGSAGQGVQDAARQARQRTTQPSGGGGRPSKQPSGQQRTAQPPAQPPAKPPGATPSQGQQSAGSQQKPQANWKSAAGTGFRRGIAGLGAVSHAAAGEYPEAGIAAAMGSRRLSRAVPQVGRIAVQKAAARVGQRQAGKIASRFVPGLQQAYGIATGTRALARGDKLGAALGYASAIPGPIGWAAVGADVARETMPSSWKQAIKDKTGITRLQQSKELENKAIQSGQGMTGIARAQQTMSTRDARKASTAYGTKQGSLLSGLGGPTKVDQKAGTLTTKGKTVKLASTQLVRDPKTGKQVVGDLAYKGGKAVYLARPSVASRDTSLTANIGRALNIGRYSKAAEQQAAKQEYRTALKNTQAYTKGLGISTQSATKQGLPGYGGAKPAPKPTSKPTPTATTQQQSTAQNIKSRMNAKRGGTRK